MDSEQAFLLEVIVGKVQVQHKKRAEKNVGFEDSWMGAPSNLTIDKSKSSTGQQPPPASEPVSLTAAASNASPDNETPSAPGLAAASSTYKTPVPLLASNPMKLLVSFAHFPVMEIFEDPSQDTLLEKREKAEEREKIDFNKAPGEKLIKDKQKARAAGMSLPEYRDCKKMKAASRTLKKFKKGKSHLFRMTPSTLTMLLKGPLVINAHEDSKEVVTTPSQGRVDVAFPESFHDAIYTAGYYTLMREMIAREGHIYWPRSYYLKETRMRRREQANLEAWEKQRYKCPDSEVKLYNRFQNLLDEPSQPLACPVCCCLDDPCAPFPQVMFQPDAPPRRRKRPILTPARRKAIQLMEPSPEPIRPPKGPVVAELEDNFQLVNDRFAFANVEAAAEFEEQRARFFAEQERYDDYMEMREGLDLTNVQGFREHVIALADPDKIPWYAGQTVFWLSSFLLLSWPLRLVLEYNTAYLHYKVTKLFGVNYEAGSAVASTPSANLSINASTPDVTEIEWGIKENTALVPSYSEALLMDTAAHSSNSEDRRRSSEGTSGGGAARSSGPLYFSTPLAYTSPPDPYREPPPYEEALSFPGLTRLRRSFTDRGDICGRFLASRRRSANIIRAPGRTRTLITMETSL